MADGGGAKCHGMQKSFIVYYNRETIRYGKAARQSTYRYKPFFSSHNASVVFITESHEELWGKSDVMAGGEKRKKEKKKKKYQAARLFVQKKMPVGGMLQAKVHRLHHLNGSILVQGEEKRICRN